MITLRSATMEDAEAVYQWRNSDYVRSTRLSQDVDEYNSHIEWWQNALGSPFHDLFMVESGDDLVGHVRLDYSETENWAEISIVLDPRFYGKGFGPEAIKTTCCFAFENDESLEYIVATILRDNPASVKAFEKAGFTECKDYSEDYLYYTYERD